MFHPDGGSGGDGDASGANPDASMFHPDGGSGGDEDGSTTDSDGSIADGSTNNPDGSTSPPVTCSPLGSTPPATYTGVTAYTGPITDATEVLSPYYTVHVVDGAVPGPLASMTNLYVYQAQVKSVNFAAFTSPLTGLPYDPDIKGTDPRGPYTANLGKASFASFQPLAPVSPATSRTSTITVTFPQGYPVSAIKQVKILSNVTTNRDGSFNATGTGNVGCVTIWPADNPYGYPAGSFSFTVTERTDSTANHGGIPQQLTIEIADATGTFDFLNSLHIFSNPHPDASNSLPASGYVNATPSVGKALATIPAGTKIHFGPGTYWLGPANFYHDKEVYLDDGAIVKYATPPPGAPRSCGGKGVVANENCGPMLDFFQTSGNLIVRGWGIIDGQAEAQQAAYTASYTDNRDGHTYQVSGNCGDGPNPLTFGSLLSNATQTAQVDGIIVRDSCSWTIQVYNAKGTASNPVVINNIKLFGYSGADTPGTSNADGMDMVDCEYTNITNSFIRTSDDLITLKQTNASGGVPTNNINVVNNTLWNEYANAMVAGEESYDAQTASGPVSAHDIVFDSNVVIHDTGKGQQMGVAGAYSGLMENITFSNIVSMETVGLFHIAEGPSNSTSNVLSYSMAPTSPDGSGSTYQSVVTFTMNEVVAPALQVGQTFALSPQSSWKSEAAVNEHFGASVSDGKGHLLAQLYTVSAVGSTTVNNAAATTITTTMTGLPLASSTTQTGTEGASGAFPSLTALFNPGTLGPTTFCNITQTNPQKHTDILVGPGYSPGEPFVSPVPNIQMIISLESQDPYVGGMPGYPNGVYPKSIFAPPQLSNIVVATSAGVSSLVTMAVVGNDFYYLASDGLMATNPATIAPDIVEETVRTRDYVAGGNVLFDYASPSVVAGDMDAPQFLNASTACPVSPWLPVAQAGW